MRTADALRVYTKTSGEQQLLSRPLGSLRRAGRNNLLTLLNTREVSQRVCKLILLNYFERRQITVRRNALSVEIHFAKRSARYPTFLRLKKECTRGKGKRDWHVY